MDVEGSTRQDPLRPFPLRSLRPRRETDVTSCFALLLLQKRRLKKTRSTTFTDTELKHIVLTPPQRPQQPQNSPPVYQKHRHSHRLSASRNRHHSGKTPKISNKWIALKIVIDQDLKPDSATRPLSESDCSSASTLIDKSTYLNPPVTIFAAPAEPRGYAQEWRHVQSVCFRSEASNTRWPFARTSDALRGDIIWCVVRELWQWYVNEEGGCSVRKGLKSQLRHLDRRPTLHTYRRESTSLI